MSQQNVLELAKQGHPGAIAVLINHSLKPKGIAAKVDRKDDCLQVTLESHEVPEQNNSIEFIRNGILKLGIAEINTLEILGQQVGNQSPAWSQTINLKSSLSPIENQVVKSEPENTETTYPNKNNTLRTKNSNSTTHSESDSNAKSVLLRDAAQKGDLQAISSLVRRAIAPRNLTVDATIQYGITLWLRIYPLATLQPQSCTQTVIKVLNDIKPVKVSLVRISEISLNEKKQIWNRFLILKNGEFVDITASFKLSLGIAAVSIVALLGYCALPTPFATTSQTATSTVPAPDQSQSQQGKWYEGGTLHNASALEWQQATYENKLATCAYFILSLWQQNSLEPSLQSETKSLDDIRVLSEQLVREMDVAMVKHMDPERNRQEYENRKVRDVATAIMEIRGWVK